MLLFGLWFLVLVAACWMVLSTVQQYQGGQQLMVFLTGYFERFLLGKQLRLWEWQFLGELVMLVFGLIGTISSVPAFAGKVKLEGSVAVGAEQLQYVEKNHPALVYIHVNLDDYNLEQIQQELQRDPRAEELGQRIEDELARYAQPYDEFQRIQDEVTAPVFAQQTGFEEEPADVTPLTKPAKQENAAVVLQVNEDPFEAFDRLSKSVKEKATEIGQNDLATRMQLDLERIERTRSHVPSTVEANVRSQMMALIQEHTKS